VSAIDLVYKIVQTSKIKWTREIPSYVARNDFFMVYKIMKNLGYVCNVPSISSFDAVNLLELNLLSSLAKDPEDVIVQLSWIRM